MNENDGTMEFEYTTNEGFGDVMLEPGFSGTAPYDCPRSYDNSELYSNSRPHDGSGPSDGSGQDYYSETNDLESKEKTEPLFVIDKTKNFRLNRTIQYETSPNKNKYGKNNFVAQRQNSCWNCNSVNHSLHNCPEPRVQWKISKNRQAFLNQKQQYQSNSGGRNNKNRFGNHKNIRYFVAGTKTLWSDLTPGKLSDDLLKALGVPKNGLPLHIYRMRQHGYPSGWLEEAKEEYSGISIYTTPNERLPLPGRENGINDYFHCNINERKLHEYPGFNAPCPPDFVDESKKFGCPEYNPDQSLKHMYERLKVGQIGKNERALSGESIHSQDTEFASISNVNLERSTEGNNLHLKTEKELKDKPPSSPEDGEITEDETRSDHNDEECLSNETVPGIDEQNMSMSLESSADTQNDSQSNVSNSMKIDNELVLTPTSKRQFGDVKSETLGTPVLKNFSSYGNRPAHEHFAKGMVDMVDHENLPNAIGTFKKLKEILKDVRQTIKDLL
ncbi:zinc finger CCHC domain-containing protein 8 homolog [Myzus persicae]|uniref:zinc finger CCHC domain-containing protein 8 homolog n=1 Tax=Myzus persicae TaxID=13164 RepID=UPI000B9317B6|nr:zinc finger CCHC domain-containing protein 8 homolog [Myzus persicae]XP_022168153.1 zinc finger CCHC domain-containing protein 8 homolog [Myzus persicae]XP_022168154.1 zinc finger CCHC domain-containing protein 8 homolog [Myzus persicae]